MQNEIDNYQQKVADYYDNDALLGFEKRAEANQVLERIRTDFRKITQNYSFQKVLEIGCGPGFDIEWFAKNYPDKEFVGIDISKEMVNLAGKRLANAGIKNAKVEVATDKNIIELFGKESFDLVYVYFGALNTAENLEKAAESIYEILNINGYAVLTFVNKWYLREMIVQLMKFKFKSAMARINTIWGGYSVDRFLPSHCYSASHISKVFSKFNLIEKKGFSILFPAWYNQHKISGNPLKADNLWNLDKKLQKTWFWSKGEYTLFVFKK